MRPPATDRERIGLTSLLRYQLGPRVSLRKPISVGILAEQAAETFGRVPIHLDRPLDVDPRGRLTLDYVEHALLVAELSAAFHAAGVRPWDRFAIAKQPSFDILTIAAAAARLGAIPALLSPRLDGEILGVLLDRLDAPFVFTDQATMEAAGLARCRWFGRNRRVIGAVEGGLPLGELRGGAAPPPAPRRDGEPLLVTHTSSTTGISKLVENSVAGVTFNARLEAMPPLAHSMRELIATCISFVHVRAMVTFMASLSRGSSLLALSATDDETVVSTFRRHRPTAVEAHPNVFMRWERLADHPADPFGNVRFFFNTFDAAHPRTIGRLLGASRRTLPLWFQVYGQSEVQAISLRAYTRNSSRRLARRGMRTRSLGWPPPGVRVRIVDPATQRPVPRGTAGMIQVRTPARSLSFVGTPEKHRERLHGAWFDTGDWGRRTRLGDIEILDRVADRIPGVASCLWVEDVLLERIPDAAEIVLVPDAEKRPVPVVCMRDGTSLNRSTWRRAVRGLGAIGEPVEVAEADLKRTATEKARRYLLTELVSAGGPADGSGPAHDRAEILLRDGS